MKSKKKASIFCYLIQVNFDSYEKYTSVCIAILPEIGG